jgi:hypothetical protein
VVAEVNDLREIGAFEAVVKATSLSLRKSDDEKYQAIVDAIVRAAIPAPEKGIALAQFRANRSKQLLDQMPILTAQDVANLSSEPIEVGTVRKWLERGQVFAIEVTKEGSQTRFPAFQFDEAGRPWPVLKKALTILREHLSPWSIAMWFYAPRPVFGNKRAADIMSQEEAILEVARKVAEPVELL